MSRTKIVILQMKEIVYTAIFVGFGILLLVLLFFMFWPDKEKETKSTSSLSVSSASQETSADNPKYIAGIYTSELTLGDSTINLRVSIDENNVKAVELVNLEESVETMYPLIKPAVKQISDQLAENISPEEVVLSEDSPYTSQLILDSVSQIIENASVE